MTRPLECWWTEEILFINAHFVADNVSHALASSATVRPTFNVDEKVVVIRNWTPKEEGDGCMAAVVVVVVVVVWQQYY